MMKEKSMSKNKIQKRILKKGCKKSLHESMKIPQLTDKQMEKLMKEFIETTVYYGEIKD